MDFALVLIIGLAVSLVMSEIFGVSPGGIITPAYLAMTLDDPQVIIVICVIALASYLIVQYGLSRIMMIYGRRKFIAFMLVAVTMKLAMDYLFSSCSVWIARI
jgi:poly-gamma-glutamate biosynthesis protein PgsC/CapC